MEKYGLTGVAGWTCPNCGSFVPNGVTHTCTFYGYGGNPAPVDPVVQKLDEILHLLRGIKGELETLRMRR